MRPITSTSLPSLLALLVATLPTYAETRPEVAEVKKEVVVIVNGEHSATSVTPAGAHRVEIFRSGSGDLPGTAEMAVSDALTQAFSAGSLAQPPKAIANASFSADIISEKTQILADGNRIVTQKTTHTARDNAGRTRQEVRNADGSVQSIHLHDPSDGSRHILSPAKKTATKLTMDRDLNKRIEALRERARSMAKDGKTATLNDSRPGEEIVISRRDGPTGSGVQEAHEEVRVNILRGDMGKAAQLSNALPQLGGLGGGASASALGTLFQDHKWARNAVTRDLGNKFIDGVRAEGKASTYTIPANEIGNQQAITVTRETWFSPELQITVYSKLTDPRIGEQVYRLANLSRLEPPANLFSVPADYTLRETPLPGLNLREERIVK